VLQFQVSSGTTIQGFHKRIVGFKASTEEKVVREIILLEKHNNVSWAVWLFMGFNMGTILFRKPQDTWRFIFARQHCHLRARAPTTDNEVCDFERALFDIFCVNKLFEGWNQVLPHLLFYIARVLYYWRSTSYHSYMKILCYIDGRMDRLSLKIKWAREISYSLVEILTGFMQKIQFDVLLFTVIEEHPLPETCP